ncbi:Glucose-1-phosphate adenylyltransferase [Streptomyces tendae]
MGTLDAYYDAHMDLIAERPAFNLYNREWPVYTHSGQLSPARFNAGGIASESIISAGCLIRGQVTRSVLSPGVVVDPGAVVQGSVLHDNVHIGRGAVVRGAVLDKNVEVPPGATIGVNPERDGELYTVSEGGVIALGKGQWVPCGRRPTEAPVVEDGRRSCVRDPRVDCGTGVRAWYAKCCSVTTLSWV